MSNSVPASLLRDYTLVENIPGIPAMLELVCHLTGMGFSAVARVTAEHWLACKVCDKVNFGLTEGGELKVETTICSWIRDHKAPVVFNEVKDDDDQLYRDVAAMYGFTSYISYPIYTKGNLFFGTLCAIDPKKMDVEAGFVRELFTLFSRWISFHLQTIPVDNSFTLEADTMLTNATAAAGKNERANELISELRKLMVV